MGKLDMGNVSFGVFKLYDELLKANRNRKKARFFDLRQRICVVRDQCARYGQNDLDHLFKIMLEVKFVGGGQQNYSSRWKAITITTDWIKNPIGLVEFEQKIKDFLDSRFTEYLYCIEHINTNLHCHIAARFRRLKWPQAQFKLDLQRIFTKPECDISLKDTRGNCHLISKNEKQIENFLYYIIKDEPDKIVRRSRQFYKYSFCDHLFTIIFFALFKECRELTE